VSRNGAEAALSEIERVGIVGCGLMGSGIAEVAARAGLHVTVREPSEQLLEAGRLRIEKSMARGVEREKLSNEDRDAALRRLTFSTDLDGMAECDLIIEAIVEELEAKQSLFARLDDLCDARTIFASNTSSLSITDISASTARVDRVVGLHFFNPVPVMRLVEVVRSVVTSADTVARSIAFVRRLGKEWIESRARPGFIVNLLLVPYLLDAVRQLERGVGTVRDIDLAMTLGCGHPMGPLALCDLVGIDTLLKISGIMYYEYCEERYAPPPLLRRLVSLGRHGKKSGQGFYDWDAAEPVPLPL